MVSPKTPVSICHYVDILQEKMGFSEDYLNYVNDQIEGIEGIYSKRMFGGIGFFKDDLMFGAIMGGIFRLKADETTISNFEKFDLGTPFGMEGKRGKMPYYQVPESVLEDKKELKKWVMDAVEVASRAKKKKK